MHSFNDMIEIMEREKTTVENWKRWALAGALTAGALAGGAAVTKHPNPMRDYGREYEDNLSEPKPDDPPRRGDYYYHMTSKWQGISSAEHNLKERQKRYKKRIEMGASANEK